MKVLYISGGKCHDIQCDALYHGLRSLLGYDCIDVEEMEFMYKGTEHGGYTLWGLLPRLDVDRTDIPAKLRTRYFDLVIYGSIQRCRLYWDEVQSAYARNHILFVDGEDDDNTIAWDLVGCGLYFKRERSPGPEVIPIQFAVPLEKIVNEIPIKTRLMAPLIPGDFSTYGYVTEDSYRQMYAESRFGQTKKKGGWDCLRHYEILMMGALPYFAGLEECPSTTMEVLPRHQLLEARRVFDTWPERESEYDSLASALLAYTKRCLTTESLARRVLAHAGYAA